MVLPCARLLAFRQRTDNHTQVGVQPLGLRTYTLRGPRAVPCIGLGYTCDLTVAIVWGITSLHNYQGITPGISRLTTLNASHYLLNRIVKRVWWTPRPNHTAH